MQQQKTLCEIDAYVGTFGSIIDNFVTHMENATQDERSVCMSVLRDSVPDFINVHYEQLRCVWNVSVATVELLVEACALAKSHVRTRTFRREGRVVAGACDDDDFSTADDLRCDAAVDVSMQITQRIDLADSYTSRKIGGRNCTSATTLLPCDIVRGRFARATPDCVREIQCRSEISDVNVDRQINCGSGGGTDDGGGGSGGNDDDNRIGPLCTIIGQSIKMRPSAGFGATDRETLSKAEAVRNAYVRLSVVAPRIFGGVRMRAVRRVVRQ